MRVATEQAKRRRSPPRVEGSSERRLADGGDGRKWVWVPPFGGETSGGSKRMRRARYLAGADTSLEVESARECRCCPAIPTSTCAPARHAGLSTNYCMDHQVSSSNATKSDLVSSTVAANWCKLANGRCSRVCVVFADDLVSFRALDWSNEEKFMVKKQVDKRP
jgi:hypothetical protein